MQSIDSAAAMAALRHDLRTPINHIVGYCEMLLEDASADAHADRQTTLEGALRAVRDALALIDQTLACTRTSVGEGELDELRLALGRPQRTILDAAAWLLLQPGDSSYVSDVLRVRTAAEQLLGPWTASLPAPPAPASPAERAGGSAAPAGVQQPDAPGSSPTRSGTILVVDDVEENRTVLERRLRRQGFEVECAMDGRLALECVARRRFDLVLLDVRMPELDGYRVLQHLKADPASRDIPVIMISAVDDMDSVVRCIEAGAEDYLPKPFDAVLLGARINASLEKKRLRDAEVEYLRRVAKVIDAATAVESGIYSSSLLIDVADGDDEVGRLARVFDSMAERVRSREERLQRQAHALKIEVEMGRKRAADPESRMEDVPLSPGQDFAGRYHIHSLVGIGGMGIVYCAEDRELGERVAIKTVRSSLISFDGTALERFRNEIRLARRITHPNVVRIFDIGECDGTYFVTMEYVEGITLRDLIDTRERLTAASTLAAMLQLARALDVAHEQGVVHRDVKPQNLLLDGEGTLKVMDFGIARIAEGAEGLTQAGLVVGTPAYMSPEQLLDEPVGAASDIYAAGVVMYECLTGRLPFSARTPVALISKVLMSAPEAPIAVNPEIPPALSALVMRLLSRDITDRPASASQLAELLSGLG
jgi:CheY-like chemotaxis protein